MPSDLLKEIAAYKKSILGELHQLFSILEAPEAPPRSFKAALVKKNGLAVIAEIKKASPSQGVMRTDFNPTQLAQDFEKQGASALSVLTDEKYFNGGFDVLNRVSQATALPLLCKDFIIDPIQIHAARLCGASAILLICAMHTADSLKELADVARQLNMEILFEIHAAHELKLLENIPYDLIGINNRNLSTLEIDLQTCHNIAPMIPADKLLVCESGITSPSQVPAGARAVLIGTALVKDPNLLTALAQTPR